MIFLSSKNYWCYLKKKNAFVKLDFKYQISLSTSEILYLERLSQNIWILKFDSVKKLPTSSSCCLCYRSTKNEYYLCLFLRLINFQKRHPQNYHSLIQKKKIFCSESSSAKTHSITSSTVKLSLARVFLSVAIFKRNFRA